MSWPTTAARLATTTGPARTSRRGAALLADRPSRGAASPGIHAREQRLEVAVVDDSAALVSVLERCPLLAGLDAREVAEVAALCRFQAFAAQTDVFVEGQRCDGLWVLATGRVRLYHSAADGRQHVVSFRGPSSALELGPALDRRTYTATATALEDSVLVFVPRPVISQLAQRYPVTVRNTIDQLCIELRQRDIATAVATLKDARGRIGCALLQLARQYGVDTTDGLRIGFRLTRQDIADRSGVTIETAIRVLSDLQRQGILRTSAQMIEILDMERLQDPTNCGDCQFDCSVFGPGLPLTGA